VLLHAIKINEDTIINECVFMVLIL
jgi:hypothetical protein